MRKQLERKIFQLNQVRKQKTIVLIVGTMRSGSTLLKALLGSASDISHLPEIDFEKYHSLNCWKAKALSPKRIIILKKPATFNNPNYPNFSAFKKNKKIILVRDAYETVSSIKKMNEEVYPKLDQQWPLQKLVEEYWYPVVSNAIKKATLEKQLTKIVKYESLLENPLKITKDIFKFVGSEQKSGIDAYVPPTQYTWGWGVDDGSDKIQSLKVQNLKKERTSMLLLDIIQRSEKVNELRKQLGYLK